MKLQKIEQMKNEITELDKKIEGRMSSFMGNIEDLEAFICNAINRESHALTTPEYAGIKPTLRQYELLSFDIFTLKEILSFLSTKQMTEYYLEKETKNLNNGSIIDPSLN